MNVKRFIAETTIEAMEKVRAEMGNEAVILNTRTIRRKGFLGIFKKPLIEVVAAFDDSTLERQRQKKRPKPLVPPPPPPPPQKDESDGFTPILNEITQSALEKAYVPPRVDNARMDNLENKLNSISTTLMDLMTKVTVTGKEYEADYPTEILYMVNRMLENEVHPGIAHKIGREVTEIVRLQGANSEEVMFQIMSQYINDPAPIKLKKFRRVVCMLVGPTGVGKTTTLAKLAAIYSLQHSARVGLITCDTYRIAAVEQLKTYAEILETPLDVVYSPADIADALKQHEDKDIVFIDTVGKSPNDETHGQEVRDLIAYSGADEVFLCISATTGYSGCKNIVDKYKHIKDYKLVITKLDETPSKGLILNAAYVSGKQISYVTKGQKVPDDIEIADSGHIINTLIGRDNL